MDELVENFEKSLFDDSKDIIGDYLEIGIDSIIDGGILKEIPIVKTIVGVLKVGKNVHDRNLLKQTLVFINEFNRNEIRQDKIEEYKKRIENDQKKCEDELGRIILLLNNFIDREKSIMLSKVFKDYVGQLLNWNEFCEYSEIINRLFIQDFSFLQEVYLGRISDTTNRSDIYKVERLNSLGIIGMTFKSSTISTINGVMSNRQDSYLTMNNNGKKFMNIVMK
ncbi:MAG TPA: hypothetical protein OIM35_00170 [Clostridiaceae bacterium]|nr:hypothetical protein [Clostridiaceae bacterium]